MQVLDAKSIVDVVKKSKAKVKVVNLWASWCAPCQKELPEFAKAEKKLQDTEFFYVSGDDDSDSAKAEKIISEMAVGNNRYRLKPISEQAFKEFSNVWSGSLPATFIFYQDKLADYTVKPLSEKQLTKWVKFRLAHPTRKYLIDETSEPKVKSSQGKTTMKSHTDFESKKMNPDFASVQDVVAEEVAKKSSDVVLIDVRQPEEFTGELSHIPGAKLVPLATLPEKLIELPKDKTIVFVCRSGGRSAKAAAFAQSSGYDSVYNLKGGMLRWNELKLETESNKK